MNFTILRFDSLDSTNTEALKQAKLGADEGLCVVARQQTAGRGRHGRTWVSPKDAGLYFSIVLRPQLEAKYLTLITLMAGVAVHDTLSEIGLEPDIKWVNDILVNDKKICGILAETSETPKGLAVIVGIGINLTSANFPDELAETATSIEAETDHSIGPSGTLEEPLVRFLGSFYTILTSEQGPATILKEWQRRSTYFSGKNVQVRLADDTITGVTDGLEPNGALRIRMPDGGVTIVQGGDVERLRTAK